MLKEFKEFIRQGNVLSVAVGFVMGAAFKAIIDSVVNDLIMPIVALATGGIDFTNLFIALDGKQYPTLQAALDAGVATLAYGKLIQAIVTFFIIAFVLFLIVRSANRLKKKEEDNAPTMKACPFCKSEVAVDATRCPHCTSELN
ncbi:large conductance mechanosensitive channel protein MscL [Guggenheimella bovis]